jgi:hypothetical protein
MTHHRKFSRLGFGLALGVAVFGFASTAEAGPPLLCHPFEIGGAKSLPWGDGSNWNSPKAGYDLINLVQDTLALLSPELPVIVRMETLRRAAIYSQRDQTVASGLLVRLMARALDAKESKARALAWFDAGYLVETYNQAKGMFPGQGSRTSQLNVAESLNGYGWVTQALQLSGEDPAMEFAASLMDRGDWPNPHFGRALAGAREGSLLARNLVLHSGDRVKSIAELRARYGKVKD